MQVAVSAIRWEGTWRGVGQVEDVTWRRRREAELSRRALHDPLTGLPNRQMFMDRLRLALDDLNRRSAQVAALYVDLDRFKPINDTLGHDVGDRILTEIASRLRRAVRTQDTPARLGGDEFGVVCADIRDDVGLRHLARRLISTMNEPITWVMTRSRSAPALV